MTSLTEFWTLLGLLAVCFVLGGLPLTGWIVRGFTGQRLAQIGTGNVGVSAAFYHGGQGAGILAVLAEALKGVTAVLLLRIFMPGQPVWEIAALIALVAGRYIISHGAGTTNVVWGFILHDWKTAFLVALIGGIGFTLLREKRIGRLSVLILLPLITALLHPTRGDRIVAVMVLSLFMGLIYRWISDDLDLPADTAHQDSRQMFKFFRGDRAIQTLDDKLDARTVGEKAARLAQLKRLGYPVPPGWVLPPGDDPQPLIDMLDPSPEQPLVVRSSAIGEDSEVASAAGQYDSVLHVTNRDALQQAIAQCQLSYSTPNAVQYRQDRNLPDQAMAVLVQRQIQGAFSGVAFSRDPITRQGDAVLLEALPGSSTQVVSGKATPESYRVWITDRDLDAAAASAQETDASSEKKSRNSEVGTPGWWLPEELSLEMEGSGDVPAFLIRRVAYLVRYLEHQSRDVPQDVEWTYDGQQLWVLQARPITTLLPVWTRKIAAEVIPGFIRPLTWSINQPLTCGVWGDLFTIVLGDRAKGLDFSETATLHHSSAYFNASLLGEIFRRMGLPPESLDFLTRGAKFSRPPLSATLRNLPGLLRLLSREWSLPQDFAEDEQRRFSPGFAKLNQNTPDQLTVEQLIVRIHRILELLKHATYYNILAPLSVSLWQALLQVSDAELDSSRLPEVAALRSLRDMASDSRALLPEAIRLSGQRSTVLTALAESSEGEAVRRQLDHFLETYGYLSEVATDIAVPTWRDDPRPVYDLFAQFLKQLPPNMRPADRDRQRWQAQKVQQRLDLKGKVAEVYNRLLAELRWSFVALERQWVENGQLEQTGDLFFLTFDEIQQAAASLDVTQHDRLRSLIEARRHQWQMDSQVSIVPFLVYGQEPPVLQAPQDTPQNEAASGPSANRLRGIGASPGQARGTVKILRSLQSLPVLDKTMILVVPYADSGWAPVLAQVGGLIADVGGRLSHGAIVAREYGIPAVMDVRSGTTQLKEGQEVYIDGETGIVDVLEASD